MLVQSAGALMPFAHVKAGSPARKRKAAGGGTARRMEGELRAQNERFSAAGDVLDFQAFGERSLVVPKKGRPNHLA